MKNNNKLKILNEPGKNIENIDTDKIAEFVEFQDKKKADSVGVEPEEKYKKIKHLTPMLTFDKISASEKIDKLTNEIQKFLNSTNKIEILCELKIDGTSFNALYNNGLLQKVATRGNKITGEDITDNVRTINNFPQKISYLGKCEVRGEIYILKKDAEKLGAKNVRNYVSGSLRQLDSKITAKRNLKYFAFQVYFYDAKKLKTQYDSLMFLKRNNFLVNDKFFITDDTKKIDVFYNEILKQRNNLEYEIDGIVYKVNSLSLQDKLGLRSYAPRWARAHKFPNQGKPTQILDIEYSVGRTGSITPVAILKPVEINGVEIKRASLYNDAEIKRLDIRKNDYVMVTRAGDVIPKIESVCIEQRQKKSAKFISIERCPSCNSIIINNNSDIMRKCSNLSNCQDVIIERIKHFVSRDAFNIKGLGTKQIKLLVDDNYIKSPVDIFKLEDKKDKMCQLKGWGEKTYYNIIKNIQDAKSVELKTFIYALGIDNIGINTANILSKEFVTYENLYKYILQSESLSNRLTSIDGIGNVVVNAILNFFSIPENIIMLQGLQQNIHIITHKNKNTAISGKKIVFTGKFTKTSRQDLKNKAENLGATVSSSISKNTDILVTGDNVGNKYKKAQKLGISIKNEVEWLNIIQKYNTKNIN